MVEEVDKTTKASEKTKKSHKGWIWGIIGGIVGIAIIAVVVIVVLNLKPVDPDDPTASISYSKSFFIYDKNYTLWNADGKRLTENEYSDVSNFVGGYAYVQKEDLTGIIRDNGSMSVDFDRYQSIAARGGLYLAQNKDSEEYSLITGAGREVIRGNNLDVMSSSYDGGFAVVKSDKSIAVYSYTGNLIFETPLVDDADDPAMNDSDDFGIVYYANTNYVFDVRDGKMITSFEGPRFNFEEVSNDRKMILLENYDKLYDYRLVANNRVYDLGQMEYYGFTVQNQLIGYDSSSNLGLLNDDFQVVSKVSSYIQLKDSYNYAVEENGKVVIYKNGNKAREFDNAGIASGGVLYEDYYAIESDNKVTYYNLDGAAVFNHDFVYGSIFNRHHLAVAAETEGERYLIDARGNRVTDYTARNFSVTDGGFEVENGDDKYAVANKAGKLVTDFAYDDVYYRSSAKPRNIWTGEKEQDKYDVIDADSGKIIASDIKVYDFSANYFVAKNDDKKVYYTYTGQIFYTES